MTSSHKGFSRSKYSVALRVAALLGCILGVFLSACQNTDSGDSDPVLNIRIDKDNDSLLTFDTLIITVHSKDGTFSQEVFHGHLTNPKQVLGIKLDPRVGKEFKVSIIGFKGGKQALNKEITVLSRSTSESKDLPVVDTSKADTTLPIIIAPSDTTVSEGDLLKLQILVSRPWGEGALLSLVAPPAGASLDANGYLSWKPSSSQGRLEPYSVTILYALGTRKIEKSIRIKVLNINQPPHIKPIPDQKGKVDETLSFKVEATDPDNDSLVISVRDLPSGAHFVEGLFTWKPSAGQVGNYPLKIKAFDGTDSDFVAVLLTIGDIDPPPPLKLEITWPGRDTLLNITPITVLYSVNEKPHQKKFELKAGRNKIFIDTTVEGRTAFDTVIVTLDTIAPLKPVAAGNSPVNSRTPTWHWKSGGGGNGVFRIKLNDGTMAGAQLTLDTLYTVSTDLNVGTHTLFIQERDDAGNWSPIGKHSVRIDTTKPEAPAVTATPSTVTNMVLPTWSWQGSGEDVSGLFRYKLDNSDLRTGATETRTSSLILKAGQELSEGPHSLYVQQQDSAGNWSNSGVALLRIDLTPPSVPLATISPASPTNIRRPTWNWTGGGGGMGKFRYRLDNGDLSAASENSAASFSPDQDLSESTHTLYVQERDSAGNWSQSASKAVRIDLTAPSTPKLSTASPHVTTPRPKWQWSSAGNGGSGSFRYKLNDSTMNVGATATTDTAFIPSSDLPKGERHTLYLQESDSAGNWSPIGMLTIRIHGQTGFGVGYGGAIYRTLNGGGSWDSLTSGTSQYLSAVFFTSSTTGYVVGGSTILKTSNGGTAWNPLTSGTENGLRSVYFADSNIGLTVGSSGTILRTTNAGVSWFPIPSGTSNDLYSVFFVDTKIGYAAGDNGTILKTVNAGEIWAPVSFGSYNFASIYFADANTGFAVGSLGAIVKTTNGGTSWEELTSGTLESLYSVHFTSTTTGYAVGGGGIVLKTINGGTSWTSQSPSTHSLNTLFFTDSSIGYAIGDGYAYKTTNSGNSWPGIGIGSVFSFLGLFFP